MQAAPPATIAKVWFHARESAFRFGGRVPQPLSFARAVLPLYRPFPRAKPMREPRETLKRSKQRRSLRGQVNKVNEMSTRNAANHVVTFHDEAGREGVES